MSGLTPFEGERWPKNQHRSGSLSDLGNLLSAWRLDADGHPFNDFSWKEFPLRLARVTRHPRNLHPTSWVREDLKWAVRALDFTDESWGNLGSSTGDLPFFKDLIVDELRETFGSTVPDVFSKLQVLLESSETAAILDASQLHYQRDFFSLFPLFGGLARSWRGRHNPSTSTSTTAAEIVRQVVVNPTNKFIRYGDRDWSAAASGSFHELRATAGFTEELGLPSDDSPEPGWWNWFRMAFDILEAQGRDELAARSGLVVGTCGEPTCPSGLNDARYGNAALFISAFEGRPLNDTSNWRTSDAVRRFRRAFDHPRFPHELEPVLTDLDALIIDSEENPWIWDEVLGEIEVSPGIEPIDALADLRAQLQGPKSIRSSPMELPFTGWELRFRFPMLRAFGEGRPDAAGTTHVEGMAAVHEPCRVGLPPLIGEIAELVALLPDDEDVDRAMAHLGGTGTGWRPILERMVTDLTAHIWAHEEEQSR